jgi:hypothetical protein
MGSIIPEKNTDPDDTTLRLHNPVMDQVVALRKNSGSKPIE